MGQLGVVHEANRVAELVADVAHLLQRVRLVVVLLLWGQGGGAVSGEERPRMPPALRADVSGTGALCVDDNNRGIQFSRWSFVGRFTIWYNATHATYFIAVTARCGHIGFKSRQRYF